MIFLGILDIDICRYRSSGYSIYIPDEHTLRSIRKGIHFGADMIQTPKFMADYEKISMAKQFVNYFRPIYVSIKQVFPTETGASRMTKY